MKILTSDQIKEELNELSNKWSDAEEKVILLEAGKKAMFSKCVLKHKKFVKTNAEAEHEAMLDKDYQDVVKSYALAEKKLIQARYEYDNYKIAISFKQTEMKLGVS